IATGSSLVEAAKALKTQGAKKIYAAITHGILSADAVEKVEKSVIDSLVITDSIFLKEGKTSKKIKVVSTGRLFAEAIKRIHCEESISVLFDSVGR
ncbi:MAG: ribose-phosphate pyrophosphokinase, partial [Candidatus Omnitrophica bacterium]|nr:ribose-phosphate pyrophosphokinase [Candidatus Omnitrophota bacterium]